MQLKTLLLTALAACLIPTLAQAQGQSIAGGDQGDQRKGPPSQAERGERFDNTDTNGDGQLSLEEVEGAGAKRLAEHFDKIDADGDGQLTKDELKAAHKKRGKGKKGGNGPRTCTKCAE
jgi:hypothetical protein